MLISIQRISTSYTREDLKGGALKGGTLKGGALQREGRDARSELDGRAETTACAHAELVGLEMTAGVVARGERRPAHLRVAPVVIPPKRGTRAAASAVGIGCRRHCLRD